MLHLNCQRTSDTGRYGGTEGSNTGYETQRHVPLTDLVMNFPKPFGILEGFLFNL
ncbi:hypothetical protein MKW98_006860, partial [Papaver atlanticum]